MVAQTLSTYEDRVIAELWRDPYLLSKYPHLSEEHFPMWGRVFRFIKEAVAQQIKPDVLLLPRDLQLLVAELIDTAPPLEGTELDYAVQHLMDEWAKQKLKRLGNYLLTKADADTPVAELVVTVERQIVDLMQRSGADFYAFPILVKRFMEWFQTGEDREIVGLFDIPELDELVGKLREGMLVVIAAPTSAGKTSFAIHTALRSALKNYPVTFFSLEMTETQLVARALAHLTSIPSFALFTKKTNAITDSDWGKIKELSEFQLPFYLANNAWTIDEIIKNVVAARIKYGCRLFIVDYLQKVVVPKAETRELEVATVARELKRLALQQKVCVVALSQVNNEKERRTRESRAIEHESDVLVNLVPTKNDTEIEVLITKNRMGQKGALRVAWNAELCVFGEALDNTDDALGLI